MRPFWPLPAAWIYSREKCVVNYIPLLIACRTAGSPSTCRTTTCSSAPSARATRTCAWSPTATWGRTRPPTCGTGQFHAMPTSWNWQYIGLYHHCLCHTFSQRTCLPQLEYLQMLSGGEVEHNIGGHLRLFRHWYTDPQSMFNGRHTFDATSVAQNASVFASEYAVFDWGIKTIPRGNIQARRSLAPTRTLPARMPLSNMPRAVVHCLSWPARDTAGAHIAIADTAACRREGACKGAPRLLKNLVCCQSLSGFCQAGARR